MYLKNCAFKSIMKKKKTPRLSIAQGSGSEVTILQFYNNYKPTYFFHFVKIYLKHHLRILSRFVTQLKFVRDQRRVSDALMRWNSDTNSCNTLESAPISCGWRASDISFITCRFLISLIRHVSRESIAYLAKGKDLRHCLLIFTRYICILKITISYKHAYSSDWSHQNASLIFKLPLILISVLIHSNLQ